MHSTAFQSLNHQPRRHRSRLFLDTCRLERDDGFGRLDAWIEYRGSLCRCTGSQQQGHLNNRYLVTVNVTEVVCCKAPLVPMIANVNVPF